jgi:hypothetical protein
MEMSGELHTVTASLPGKNPSMYHGTGGCVGLRDGVDILEKYVSLLLLPALNPDSSSLQLSHNTN